MKNRNVPILLLVALVAQGRAAAQMSNGSYTVNQETISSAGGRIGSGNPMAVTTMLGLPASGMASNESYTLISGITISQNPATPPPSVTVTVNGTLNDPTAMVSVNGIPATVSGSTFTANVRLVLGPNVVAAVAADPAGNEASVSITVHVDLALQDKLARFSVTVTGTVNDPTAQVEVNGVAATIANGGFTASVPLVSGYNTITATATDPAGNAASTSVRVFVPLPAQPPAMPTVGTVGPTIPAVTTISSLTLGGTKTAGTSIWINGQQVYAADDQLTWTVTLTLVEGDNEMVIVAKDATGAASAPVNRNVILDNLPPVVTASPPSKTNFNPYLLHGSVDDSLTTVTVNGLAATRNARAFEVDVPLVLGPNAVHLKAVSPNGHVAEQDYTIVLGTTPTIQAIQPADASKLHAGASISIQISAADQEGDPMEYQLLLDGSPLVTWGAASSQSWTPGATDLGIHTLQAEVRDGYGGSNAQTVEVLVVRPPVPHP